MSRRKSCAGGGSTNCSKDASREGPSPADLLGVPHTKSLPLWTYPEDRGDFRRALLGVSVAHAAQDAGRQLPVVCHPPLVARLSPQGHDRQELSALRLVEFVIFG